jgi:hypothetical protein
VRQKQLAFPSFSNKSQLTFGGSDLKSHPKKKRPIYPGQAIHLVMRSSKARGRHSFLFWDRELQEMLHRQGVKCGVRVYDIANAGNHLHMVIKVSGREAYKRFIRSVSGLIIRKSFGLERGLAAAQGLATSAGASRKSLWDARPYTRIVSWGRDYNGLKRYLMMNRLDLLGIPREVSSPMIKSAEAILAAKGPIPAGFG